MRGGGEDERGDEEDDGERGNLLEEVAAEKLGEIEAEWVLVHGFTQGSRGAGKPHGRGVGGGGEQGGEDSEQASESTASSHRQRGPLQSPQHNSEPDLGMAAWRNGSAFGFDCQRTKRLQFRVLRWSWIKLFAPIKFRAFVVYFVRDTRLRNSKYN